METENKSECGVLEECYDYINTLDKCAQTKTVPDLLANVAYVFLCRSERIRLAWRILKTIFQ